MRFVSIRTTMLCAVAAVALLAPAVRAQSNDAARRAGEDAARRAAEAARQQAEQQRQQQLREQTLRLVTQGLDPARIHTVGLWPGQSVPCKLPRREQPYSCHRLLEGPALILTELPLFELIVARGDAALARGERAWWLKGNERLMPISLAAGEVLYLVGDHWPDDTDLVATLYR
jgi:hypothetical protein